jgi:hypothetical protein
VRIEAFESATNLTVFPRRSTSTKSWVCILIGTANAICIRVVSSNFVWQKSKPCVQSTLFVCHNDYEIALTLCTLWKHWHVMEWLTIDGFWIGSRIYLAYSCWLHFTNRSHTSVPCRLAAISHQSPTLLLSQDSLVMAACPLFIASARIERKTPPPTVLLLLCEIAILSDRTENTCYVCSRCYADELFTMP